MGQVTEVQFDPKAFYIDELHFLTIEIGCVAIVSAHVCYSPKIAARMNMYKSTLLQHKYYWKKIF
ncbi:hypothetical protein H5410_035483 [Solanum commersonii]|uniref:Uncharacterized protein n=1 Tax=Solanum commersonii TaxID=4109 RepID=A0A9J5Y0T3_SOLCO|nr:hypothetical protein H5410_035483 [Solanum commersonii]